MALGFNRVFYGLAVAAMAEVGSFVRVLADTPGPPIVSRPMRRSASSAMHQSPRRYRSRWKAQRKRGHRNMNRVSKRVRRRHRRARRA